MKTKNKWGETIYVVSFKEMEDAKRFAKMIAKNPKRFSLKYYRRRDFGWEVVYRPRREFPWR